MDAMGHGEREPMTASEALKVAAQAEPAPPHESHLHREDPVLGSTVRVRPSDYGQETVEGELVHLSDGHCRSAYGPEAWCTGSPLSKIRVRPSLASGRFVVERGTLTNSRG